MPCALICTVNMVNSCTQPHLSFYFPHTYICNDQCMFIINELNGVFIKSFIDFYYYCGWYSVICSCESYMYIFMDWPSSIPANPTCIFINYDTGGDLFMSIIINGLISGHYRYNIIAINQDWSSLSLTLTIEE